MKIKDWVSNFKGSKMICKKTLENSRGRFLKRDRVYKA
jgi:hypothetical protein